MNVFSCRRQEWIIVVCCCVLCLGPIGYFGVGVRLVLRLVRERVMKTCECVLDVGQNGEVDLAFFIVPVEVNSEVA